MALSIAVSCREIPPEIPDGYVGSQPEDSRWPPPAVYHEDALHPANRLHHRIFVLASGGATLDEVDRLEIQVLAERVKASVRERGVDGLGPTALRRLRSDLENEIRRCDGRGESGDEELVEVLRGALDGL